MGKTRRGREAVTEGGKEERQREWMVKKGRRKSEQGEIGREIELLDSHPCKDNSKMNILLV